MSDAVCAVQVIKPRLVWTGVGRRAEQDIMWRGQPLLLLHANSAFQHHLSKFAPHNQSPRGTARCQNPYKQGDKEGAGKKDMAKKSANSAYHSLLTLRDSHPVNRTTAAHQISPSNARHRFTFTPIYRLSKTAALNYTVCRTTVPSFLFLSAREKREPGRGKN
ncbi:unnamed protein product [Leuciscus chuanchicus]